MSDKEPFDKSLVEPQQVPTHQCSCCEKMLPLTRDYFDRDVTRPTGFKEVCKECRRLNSNRVELGHQVKELGEIEKQIIQFVNNQKWHLFSNSKRGIEHAELLERILNGIGGMDGFAMMYIDTLMKVDPRTRASMLTKLAMEKRKSEEMAGDQDGIKEYSIEQLKEKASQLQGFIEQQEKGGSDV